jgi:hypothetical protein
MNNWCICWFSRIFVLRILIFKVLTTLRLYKSFGDKELIRYANGYVSDTIHLRLFIYICLLTDGDCFDL